MFQIQLASKSKFKNIFTTPGKKTSQLNSKIIDERNEHKNQLSWNQVYDGKTQKLFLETLKTLRKQKLNLAVSQGNKDISAVSNCQKKKSLCQ